MEKTAIAYASDIILGNTGEVIDRAFQKARVEEYAKENNIKILAWFEDEAFSEYLFSRPKIKEMIAFKDAYDYVLVERVWTLSRKWKEVKALLKVLEPKQVKVQATTTLWDCVSQMARHHYRNAAMSFDMIPCALETEAPAEAASINLVETYGRSSAIIDYVPGQVAAEKNRGKANVRKPNNLMFHRLRYKSA
jgi:hypothetical protein